LADNVGRHFDVFFVIIVIIIHEFHGDTSFKQNFRAAWPTMSADISTRVFGVPTLSARHCRPTIHAILLADVGCRPDNDGWCGMALTVKHKNPDYRP